MIVAAHNYDSHFGRIRKLDSGDRIDFTDVTGTVYHYQVIQTEILPDTAVEEMRAGKLGLDTVHLYAQWNAACNGSLRADFLNDYP